MVEPFQNSKEFTWFGTLDNLNLYDEYNFTVFKTVLNDSASLTNNDISLILEDTGGKVWIDRYAAVFKKFLHYTTEMNIKE